MLDEKAIGVSMEEDYEYTWRDVALYNIAVGAHADELDYVFEKNIKAVPSFATMPCTATFGTIPFHANLTSPTSLIEMPAGGVVHMNQKTSIKKPIPVNAKLHVKKVISGVYDMGPKGANILVDVIAYDEKGEEVFSNTMGYLRQNCGGFGGKPVPAPSFKMPEGEPEFEVAGQYPMDVAALYRLTGDTNPLHVEPAFAQKIGFPKPIVHGLCSYGMACKILSDKLFPGKPEAMKTFEAQFRTPAFPGNKFVVKAWKLAEGDYAFKVVNEAGKSILDFGRITF